MQCPHCQQPVPDGAVYCGACGRRVIGWRGQAQGGKGRPSADAMVETQKVPPDPRLLEAAGAVPAATRRMAPDSHLLRVIRGGPADTEKVPPDPRLLEASRRSDRLAALPGPEAILPATPPTPTPPPIQAPAPSHPHAPQASAEDTAFLMQAAFGPSRSRLAVLLLADACLLVVGIYLIVSWTRRPPRRSAGPVPNSVSSKGYISWEDNGQPGRIATGPVEATFHGKDAEPAHARREPPHAEPRREPPRTEPRREPPRTEPRREPPRTGPRRPTPAEEAAARLKVIAARERFLKTIPGQVRRRQREIRRCYQAVLALRKGVQGDVDVEFEVAVSGQVAHARASRNTTGSATLGSCIAGVFLALRLPPPPGGKVVLRYPFRFTPQTHSGRATRGR